MQVLIDLLSYNPNVAAVFGDKKNFKLIAQMKLHKVCLDFDLKFYTKDIII